MTDEEYAKFKSEYKDNNCCGGDCHGHCSKRRNK
jgi:hypothetical protein